MKSKLTNALYLFSILLSVFAGRSAQAYLGLEDSCKREQAAAEEACTTQSLEPGWTDSESAKAKQDNANLESTNNTIAATVTQAMAALASSGSVANTATQAALQKQRAQQSAVNARNKAQQCRNGYVRCMMVCNSDRDIYKKESALASVLPGMGQAAQLHDAVGNCHDKGKTKCEEFEKYAKQADQQAEQEDQKAQENQNITQAQSGTAPSTSPSTSPSTAPSPASSPASSTVPVAAPPVAAQPGLAPVVSPSPQPVTSTPTVPKQPSNCITDGDRTCCGGADATPGQSKLPPTKRGQVQLSEYDENGRLLHEYRSVGLPTTFVQPTVSEFGGGDPLDASGGAGGGRSGYNGPGETGGSPEGFFSDADLRKMEQARAGGASGGGGGSATQRGGGRNPAAETHVGGRSGRQQDGVTGAHGPSLFEKISSQYVKQSPTMVRD